MNLSELSGHLVKTDPTRSEEEKNNTEIKIVNRDEEPEEFKQAFDLWTDGFWNRTAHRKMIRT